MQIFQLPNIQLVTFLWWDFHDKELLSVLYTLKLTADSEGSP